MRNDPEAIVDGFYRALMANDVPAQLAYLAEDVVFFQHLPEGLIGHSGLTAGKGQFSVRLEYMYAHWEVVELVPVSLRVENDQVHGLVSFVFRYRPTGGLFEGRIRHIFKVFDGHVVRIDEFVDAALLEAFMRLNAPRSSDL